MRHKKSKSWYEYIPHPVALLFGIVILVSTLTYIVPAGTFDRELIGGRERVVAGTYETIASTPVAFMDVFRAFSIGFKQASDIIFLILVSGIMFGILDRSKMIENSVGTLVKSLGLKRKYFIVVVMTFIFGLMGVAVGYENNIALVPIAAVLSLALGGDLMLAAGMSVGAITVGFGLSPINPYTVGIGHQIAELPLYSAWLPRTLLCISGLSILAWYNVRYFKKIQKNGDISLSKGISTEGFELTNKIENYQVTTNNWLVLFVFIAGLIVMLYGVFIFKWKLQEMSAIFILIAIAAGIVARIKTSDFSETALKSIAIVAPGAFMVGYARTIGVILEMGHINDTIAFQLAEWLKVLPSSTTSIFMSIAQSGINLFIPSGSGQALATLPIMIPLGDLVGLPAQATIQAFQIGDGVTNLFNPTLGGLIAMLGLCRIPFDRWLRFIFPVTFIILIIAWLFLIIAF